MKLSELYMLAFRLLVLYTAIIKPCMTYACPILHTTTKLNYSKATNYTKQVSQSVFRSTVTDSYRSPTQYGWNTTLSTNWPRTFSCTLPTHPNELLHNLEVRRAPRWTLKKLKTKGGRTFICSC